MSIPGAINQGYTSLANVLGLPMTQYRVTNTAFEPIDFRNFIGTMNVLVSLQPDFKLSKPALFNQIEVYGAFDVSGTQLGDYLVDSEGTTYFVSALQSLTPTGLVKCNTKVSITRPTAMPSSSGYAVVPLVYQDPNPLALCWPASLVNGTKGERAEENLPDSERMPVYLLTMPSIPDQPLKTTDRVQDVRGALYEVMSVVETEQGVRAQLDYKGG